MTDILFRTDSHIFSYRVTGVCIQNDSVLLQKPTGDDGFAFPAAMSRSARRTKRRCDASFGRKSAPKSLWEI